MDKENLSRKEMEKSGSANSPIAKWKKLISANEISDERIKMEIEKIYLSHQTDMAEIAYNSYCRKKSQQCKHCIYHEDYHKFNKILSVKEWKKGIDNLLSIGIRNFSFCGRGLNDTVFELIDYVKEKCMDSQISLIADGPHMKNYSEKLSEARIDTLDVSLDGMKEIHDNQRNFPGAYDVTMSEVKKFQKKNKHFSRVNILTTLTNINKDCISEMIRDVNGKLGIKNFFVSPMAFVEGYKPNKSLYVSAEDYCKVFDSVRKILKELDDSYVEFNAYHARDIIVFKENYPKIWNNLKEMETGLSWSEEKGNNILSVYLFPTSLSCVTEFPVNSNGDVFTGLVMCMGRIPDKYVFGNVMNFEGKNRKEICEEFVGKDAFFTYVDWFKREREILNRKQ